MITKLVDKLLAPAPQKYPGVMGVFAYADDAATAVRALRQVGHKDLSVYSPVPYHDIEHALEQGPSLVRWVTFGGAVLGLTGGFSLCIYSVMSYPLVVGGKELISLPPFVVIGYESMILLGALANLVGMLAFTRLPQLKSKAPYDPRFSEDKIGIWVPCAGEDAARVEKMLRGQGAEEVKRHV
jgi:molybdopterin-containing oxidoreductase family membrane subunit